MKKHMFWLVELFVWILILFLVSGSIMFFRYTYKRNFNTYQIFLPDVDGLINGSPVKILGIQVGYVNQIDIVGDDVYVKFIINDSKIKLPPGIKATVEFSGLGGSKSLELYPPESKEYKSDKLIIAQKPKRISDSLGLLSNMFDQIVDITYIVSNFMDKIGFIKTHTTNGDWQSRNADSFLKFANDKLDKMQQQSDKLSNNINKLKEGKMNGKNDGKN